MTASFDGIAPVTSRYLADGTLLVTTPSVGEVIHYDTTGTILGSVTLPFYASNVAIDPFGAIFVIIYGGQGAMKFDGLSGQPLWPQVLPLPFYSNYSTAVDDVAIDSSGDLVITGINAPDNSTQSLLTGKWNGNTGASIWGPITYSPSPWVSSGKIGICANNDVVIASSPDGNDISIIRYSAIDGSLLWGPTVVSTNHNDEDFPVILSPDHAGNLLLTAASGPQYAPQWMTAKFGGNTGQLLWGPHFLQDGGVGGGTPLAAHIDGMDNLVVLGNFSDSSGAGPWTTIKYDGVTGDTTWGPATVSLGQGAYPSALSIDGSGNSFELGNYFDGTGMDLVLVKRSGADGTLLWGPITYPLGESIGSLNVALSPTGDPWVSASHADSVQSSLTTLAYSGADGSLFAGPDTSPLTIEDAVSLDQQVDLNGDVLSLLSVTSGSLALTKLSHADGTPLWGPIPFSADASFYSSSHLVLDQNLNPIVTTTSSVSGTSTALLWALDGSAGTPLWGPIIVGNTGGTSLVHTLLPSLAGSVVVIGIGTDPSGSPVDFVQGFDTATGSSIWQTTLDPGFQPGEAVADSNGDLILSGGLGGLLSFYKVSGATGSIVWGPVSPASQHYSTAHIGVDGAGDFFFSKRDSSSYPAAWTSAKINGTDGAIIWGPVLYVDLTGYGDHPTGLVVDLLGNPVITGTSTTTNYNPDWATIKYDGQTGATLWGPVYAWVGSYGAPSQIKIASDGNILVGGSSPGPFFSPGAVTKYDTTTGVIIWGPVIANVLFGGGISNLQVDGAGFAIAQYDGGAVSTVLYQPQLAIQTRVDDPSFGYCGLPYAFSFSAGNGAPPYTWSIVSGALPIGLALDPATGLLSGSPAEEGSFPVDVRVTDSAGNNADRDFNIRILGNTDAAIVTATANPVCAGSSTTLSVTGSYQSYLWMPTGEVTPSIVVTPNNPTLYGVVVTDASGCTHTGWIQVGIGFGAAPIVNAPTTAPPGDPNLTASTTPDPSVGYLWSITNGQISAGQGTPQIQFTSGAPGTTMTLSLVESRAACVSDTVTVPIQIDFLDVPPGNPFHAFIDTLAQDGVTAGCGGGNFCPSDAVLRSSMAVFLLRSEHGSAYVPPPAYGVFADVPASNPFAPWIERIYYEGITGGCSTNPLMYCPNDPVTRAGMAVFLLRAEHGYTYMPPAAVGIFGDVPVSNAFAPWIEQLYNEGITGGCSSNPLLYCPANSVTRAQMAVFLVATFRLP